MKRIGMLLVLALFSSLALAQATAPAAPQEPAKTAAAQDPVKAQQPAKPAARQGAKPRAKSSVLAKKSRRSEDARRCLDKASNTEIIKCAEEYL
jgi:hypothetical protein